MKKLNRFMTLAEALRLLDKLYAMKSADYYNISNEIKKAFDSHYHRICNYCGIHTMMFFDYEMLALSYAETYGIIEYHIKNNNMIFYQSYPYEHRTIKAVVNLDTYEESRTPLKHYYKPYNYVGGRYQTIWG